MSDPALAARIDAVLALLLRAWKRRRASAEPSLKSSLGGIAAHTDRRSARSSCLIILLLPDCVPLGVLFDIHQFGAAGR